MSNKNLIFVRPVESANLHISSVISDNFSGSVALDIDKLFIIVKTPFGPTSKCFRF